MAAWINGQAAMSGGGYIQTIDIADDGTIVVSYDGSNCYIKTVGATQWENLFHQDRMPLGSDHEKWGQGADGSASQTIGINAPTIAIAPSNSDYIYVVAASRTTAGGDRPVAKIWRRTSSASDWRWEETDFFCGLQTSINLRGHGPTMKVDPANPLHVLVSDDGGAVYRTTDGFETMTCLNATGEALAGVLPSAVTTGTTAFAGTSLTFGSGTLPTEVTSRPAGFTSITDRTICLSVVNDNTALKRSCAVGATTATTVATDGISGTGVGIGDLVVFGRRASIAFDRSSSVVGDITQGVYIGWGYGADGIYATTDGCATFSAIASSPTNICFLTCSHDGVLYVLPHDGTTLSVNTPQRYQSSTWTDLGHPSAGVGNIWCSVSADPNNAGRVAFVQHGGTIQCSANYGTDVFEPLATAYDANYNLTALPRTDTEATAMSAFDPGTPSTGTLDNYMSHGQSMFDPVVSGRLWITDGIGVWYCSPPTSGTDVAVTLTGFNKNQQSIIINNLIKAPGGTLIATAQDRWGYRFPIGPTVEPVGDFGFFTSGLSAIGSGWQIDYAKTDKNFLIMGRNGTLTMVSTDEGLSWTQLSAAVGTGALIACQTPLNFVIIPTGSSNPRYVTDGTTLQECTFTGAADLSSGWASNGFQNVRGLCADLVNVNTYYAYNSNADASGGGLWRSTDSGANWTKMTGRLTYTHPTFGSVTLAATVDFIMSAVAGNEGHLILGPGSGYTDAFPMMFSSDGGANWDPVGGSAVTWLVAAGKEAPGKTYPAIYRTGCSETDDDPTDPGVFVTTDFDPNDPTADPGWTRICRAPGGNMDTSKSLVADKDIFGRAYMSTGGTGYTYVEYRQYGALR
jgi:hypothetical protein